jgi:hypothetical protein
MKIWCRYSVEKKEGIRLEDPAQKDTELRVYSDIRTAPADTYQAENVIFRQENETIVSAQFQDVSIYYHCFLGEGKTMHQNSAKSRGIEPYLYEMFPWSKNLFKCWGVEAGK